MHSLILILLQSWILNTLALLCNHMNKVGESSPAQCRGYCTSISAVTNGHSIKATYCVPSPECLAIRTKSQLVEMGNRICQGVSKSIGNPSSITHCKAIVCQEDHCNDFKTLPGNLKVDCQINQCKHATCHNKAVGPTTAAVPTVDSTGYTTKTPPGITYDITEIIYEDEAKKVDEPKPITEPPKQEKQTTAVVVPIKKTTIPVKVISDPAVVTDPIVVTVPPVVTDPLDDTPDATTTNPKFVPTEELVTTFKDLADLVTATTALNTSNALPDIIEGTTEADLTTTDTVGSDDLADKDNESEYFEDDHGETYYEGEGFIVNNAALNGTDIFPRNNSSSALIHYSLLLILLSLYLDMS